MPTATMNGVCSPAANPSATTETDPRPVWHVGHRDGSQEGPLTGAVLQERSHSGVLKREDLVWKEGWSNWMPAGSVDGLFDAETSTVAANTRSGDRQSAPIVRALQVLNSPRAFHWLGRGSGLIAVLLLVVSLAFFAFGFQWFLGALLFAILATVGQGVAAVLEKLDRICKQTDAEISSRGQA